MPVYNNFADARRLFEHLERAANVCQCRIIVVDDASFETSRLDLPRADGHIVDVRLVRNETNRGFAASVNSAIRQSSHDIILLNTDTLVFDGWVDRLKAAARTRDRIATVTPLSNAATILSYPTSPDEFKGTLETDWPSIDRICARIGARPVTIPTGVGFCMLIRRACIEAIGLFDEAAFRNGYGEECDFCRRAAAAGWLNLAAPDVFVWHRGEGSFKDHARELRKRAQTVLSHRYPDYHRLVADFIRRDPLLGVRQQIDLARISEDQRPRSLHLRSSPAPDASDDRTDIYFERRRSVIRLWRPASTQFAPLPNLPTFSVFSPPSKIRAFLEGMQTSELVVYRGIAFSPLLGWRFRLAARRAGIRERTVKESVHQRRAKYSTLNK